LGAATVDAVGDVLPSLVARGGRKARVEELKRRDEEGGGGEKKKRKTSN